MNKNKIQAVIGVWSLGIGVACAGIAMYVQYNPKALTRKTTVTNLTIPVKPLVATYKRPLIINLPAIEIKGEAPKNATMYGTPIKINKKACIKEPGSECCDLRYKVVGFNDEKFNSFRGVFYCK